MAKAKKGNLGKIMVVLLVFSVVLIIILLIARYVRNNIGNKPSSDENSDDVGGSSTSLNCSGVSLNDNKVLKNGVISCEVKTLQSAINVMSTNAGEPANIAVDGNFGNQTLSALRRFLYIAGFADRSQITLDEWKAIVNTFCSVNNC